MTDRSFRAFILISIVITLALSGLSFVKSEGQNARLGTQVTQESSDRQAATLKNVEARREDCENGNRLRTGLRESVIIGQRNTPLILSLLPQLNDKRVLQLSARETKRELAAYASVNCEAYALRAVPSFARKTITLQEQQHQIEVLVGELHSTSLQSARTRVTTVTQRCELTRLVEGTATNRSIRSALARSYRGCEQQLHEVENIARKAASQ